MNNSGSISLNTLAIVKNWYMAVQAYDELFFDLKAQLQSQQIEEQKRYESAFDTYKAEMGDPEKRTQKQLDKINNDHYKRVEVAHEFYIKNMRAIADNPERLERIKQAEIKANQAYEDAHNAAWAATIDLVTHDRIKAFLLEIESWMTERAYIHERVFIAFEFHNAPYFTYRPHYSLIRMQEFITRQIGYTAQQIDFYHTLDEVARAESAIYRVKYGQPPIPGIKPPTELANQYLRGDDIQQVEQGVSKFATFKHADIALYCYYMSVAYPGEFPAIIDATQAKQYLDENNYPCQVGTTFLTHVTDMRKSAHRFDYGRRKVEGASYAVPIARMERVRALLIKENHNAPLALLDAELNQLREKENENEG
ncbi:MAG: hypothetical protein EOP56_18135 [Sphingobacteriales bacterium]|nr:MAG: hypothetical protein EOP56_18135 [Sphingobacteriales bacterium]